MNNTTGTAVINELTELEGRMRVEWEPIQLEVLTYVNSLQPILSEEELRVAMKMFDFTEMRDDISQRIRELMRDAVECGNKVVSIQFLNRKNALFVAFEQASVTLAEANLMHRRQTILPRDFSLEIVQTLLTSLSDLQEVSSDISGMIQAPNNVENLRGITKIWKEKISETLSALTDIHMLIPTHRLQQDQLEQLRDLLTRVEQLHRPPWYFQFVEAVGGNSIEEIQQFRVNMEEYNTGIVGLYTEIEQFLGY